MTTAAEVFLMAAISAAALIGGIFVVGIASRREKPRRQPKTARNTRTKSGRKTSRSAANKAKRKPQFSFGDDDELLEMIFDSALDKRKRP